MKRQTILVAALVVGLAAGAERQPYSHYKTIVDRQMFGPLPADFDPSKMPSEAKASQKRGKQAESLTKEQEKLKSAVHFSVINVTPGGAVKVGFTDRSDSKSPRNYYLGVGESRDGWVVKAADPDTATMTVEKGEIEITLTIGGDSAKSDGATKKSGAATAAPAAAANGTTAMGGPRSGLLLTNRLNKNRMSKREMAERLEAVEKDRAKERAEREAEREREKAEAEARREQEKESLKNELRQMVLDSKASRAETKPVPEPASENSEESNNENNDAE